VRCACLAQTDLLVASKDHVQRLEEPGMAGPLIGLRCPLDEADVEGPVGDLRDAVR
jgi:hypothetical protein